MKLHLPLLLRGALLATMVSLTLAYGGVTVQIGSESNKTMEDLKKDVTQDVTITIDNESASIGQSVKLKGKTTITLNQKGALTLEGEILGNDSSITVENEGTLTFRLGAFAYGGGYGKIDVKQGGNVNFAFGVVGYNNVESGAVDKKTEIILGGGKWNATSGSGRIAHGSGESKKGEVSIQVSDSGSFTAGKGIQMAVGDNQGIGVLHLNVQQNGTFTQDGSSIGVIDATGHYDVDIDVAGESAVYTMKDGCIGKVTSGAPSSPEQNTIDITVQNHGSFQMEGGEISLATGDTAKVTVGENGTFTQSGGTNQANITLNGGTYTLSKGTVGGTVTVSSGTYNQTGGTVTGAVTVKGGKYEQTGGTVNGSIAVSESGTYNLSAGSKLGENARITVSGGKLNVGEATGAKLNLTMTGGTTDVSTGDIAGGSTLTLQSGNASLKLSAADASVTGSTVTVGSGTTLTQTAGEIIGSTLDITGTFTMEGGSVKGSGSKLTVQSNGSVTQGATATVEDTEIVLAGGSYAQTGNVTGGSITLKAAGSQYTQNGTVTDGQITLENGTYTQAGALTNTTVTQTGGIYNQDASVQGDVNVSAGAYNQNELVGGSVHVSGAASYKQAGRIVGSVTLSGGSSKFTQDQEVQGSVTVQDGTYTQNTGGTIDGKVTVQGGTFAAGGIIEEGVLVEGGGTFTQGEGTINGEVKVTGQGATFTQLSDDSTGAINGAVKVENGGAFTLKGSDSTVSGGVSVSGDSKFTLEGGTIHQDVDMNGGTFSQSGGALANKLNLKSGTYTLSGGSIADAEVSNGSLSISGSAEVSGTLTVALLARGSVQQSNGSVGNVVLRGGTYTATGGTIGSVNVSVGSNSNGSFTLNGATVGGNVTVSGARSTFTLQSGTVGGVVNVSGGKVTQGGGTVASGSLNGGNWTLSGENATITGSLTLSDGTFNQTGAKSSVGDVAQGGGTYDAQGGSIKGDVTITGGTFTQKGAAVSGGVSVSGANSKFTLESGTVGGELSATNSGTVTQNGGTVASGSLNGGNWTLSNATITGGVTLSNGTFIQKGANSSVGSVTQSSGTYTLQAGSVKGKVDVAGGTFKQDGGTVASGSLSNGSWTLGNAATVTGSLTLSGGGVFTQAGTSSVGSVEQSGGSYTAQGGSIGGNVTITGGTFTQRGTAVSGGVSVSGEHGKFTLEYGTVGGVLSATSGGTVTQNGGTVASGSLDGGSWTLGDATITGGLTFSSGTFTQTGANSSVGSVVQRGGTYTLQSGSVKGKVDVTGGIFEQNGGTVASGSLNGKSWTLGNDAVITGSLTLSDGTFNQTGAKSSVGSVVQSGGSYTAQGGSIGGDVTVTGGTFTQRGTNVSGTITVDGSKYSYSRGTLQSVAVRNRGSMTAQGVVNADEGITLDGGTLTLGAGGSLGANTAVTMTGTGTSTSIDFGNQSSGGNVMLQVGELKNAGKFNGNLYVNTEQSSTNLGGVSGGSLKGLSLTTEGAVVTGIAGGNIQLSGTSNSVHVGKGNVGGGTAIVQFNTGASGTLGFAEGGQMVLNFAASLLHGEDKDHVKITVQLTNGNISSMTDAQLKNHFLLEKGLSTDLNNAEWSVQGGVLSMEVKVTGILFASDYKGKTLDASDTLLKDHLKAYLDADLKLDTQGGEVTLRQLSGDGVNEDAKTPYQLTIEGGGTVYLENSGGTVGDTVLVGSIVSENDSLTLAKTGDSSLTVTGGNLDLAGTLDVQGGKLVLEGNGNQVGVLQLGEGTTLELGAEGVLTVKGDSALNTGTLTGAGKLVLSGTTSLDEGLTLNVGTLEVAGGGNVTGNTDITGNVLVSGGTLNVASGNITGNVDVSGGAFQGGGGNITGHVDVSGGTFTGGAGAIGGGVSVREGTFAAGSGVIIGNVDVSGGSFTAVGDIGGNVNVSDGTFTGSGGIIDGGVSVSGGAFTAGAGTITGNVELTGGTFNGSSTAGGTIDGNVSVSDGEFLANAEHIVGHVDVSGGLFTGGTSAIDGGVSVSGGTFTADAGTITGNVDVSGGTFQGGSGNITGHVAMTGSGQFVGSGGSIGGDVHVSDNASFTTGTGAITGNVDVSGGKFIGGAAGEISGDVKVSGGEFLEGSEKIAGHVGVTGGKFTGGEGTIGGGVSVGGQGNFTAGQGAITGNVDVSDGTFTGGAGAIAGHVDVTGNGKFTGGTGAIGGGVSVSNKGNFTAGQGTITGNVDVSGGTFTGGTAGGTISGDVKVSGGEFREDSEKIAGHVDVTGGTFSGGAGTIGGGVSVSDKGTFTAGKGTITGNVDVKGGSFTADGGAITGNVRVSGGTFAGGAGNIGGNVEMTGGTFTGGTGTINGDVTLNAQGVKLDKTGYTITGKLILSGDNTSASFAGEGGVLGVHADHSSDTVPSDANIQLSGTGSSIVFANGDKHEGMISMTGAGCTLDLGGVALGAKSSIYMERGTLKNAGNYEGNVFIDLRDAQGAVNLAGLRANHITDLHVHGDRGVNFTNLGAGTLTFSGNANIVVVGSQSVSGDALSGQGGTTSVFDFAEGSDGHIAFADGGALTLQLANELYYELANGQLIIHLSDVGFTGVDGDLLEYVRQHFRLRTGDGLTLDGYEISGPTTAGDDGIDIVLGVAPDNRWVASEDGEANVSSHEFDHASKVVVDRDVTVNSSEANAESTLRQLEGSGNLTLNAEQGKDMTLTLLNENLSVDGMEMFGDTEYQGNITSTGAGKVDLVKDGNAELNLTGNVTINGGLTVNDGKLDLNGQSNSVGTLSMPGADTNPELAVNGSLSVKETSTLNGGTLSGSGEIVVEKGLTLGENLKLGDIAPAMKVQKDATLSIESTKGATLGGLSGGGNVSITQAQELVLNGDQSKETPDAFSGKINFAKGSGTLRMDGYVNQEFDGVQAETVTLDALSEDGSSHTHSKLSFTGNNTFQALQAGGEVDVQGHLTTTGNMEFGDTSRVTLHVDLANTQTPLLSTGGNLSLHCAQLLVDLTGRVADPSKDLSAVLAEGLSISGADGSAYAPGTRVNAEIGGEEEYLQLFYEDLYLTVEGEAPATPEVALTAAEGDEVAAPDSSEGQQLVLHGTPIPDEESPLRQAARSNNSSAGVALLAYAAIAGAQSDLFNGVFNSIKHKITAGDVVGVSRIAAAVAGSTVTAVSSAVDDGLRDHLLRMRGYAQQPNIKVDEGKRKLHFWVTPEVNFARVDADGDESGYDMDSWGGNLGADIKVLNGDSRVGLALSASYGDLDANAADSADGSIDSYYLSLYTHIRTGKWLHTGILALGTHSADLDRTVNYDEGVYRTDGSTDAFSAGLFYELAYDLKLDRDGKQLLQPHVQMTLRRTTVSDWSEDAPGGMGLNVDDSDATTFTLGVGTRWVSFWNTGAINRSVRTELGATIAQDFGDTQPEADVALQINPGFRHAVRGSEAGNTSVQLSAGVSVPVSNTVQIFLNAASTLRTDSSTWGLGLGVRASF